jgi:putative two-component system response regulator
MVDDPMDTAHILIVDDDPMSQKLMRDALSTDGYELVFATTGTAAIDEATRRAPDVILLDVRMPGMDGLEVCRHLRLDSILADVPIILVTALADRDSRLRGLEAGADDYVSKPVDVIELNARVRNVVQLNRYRKLRSERMRALRAEAESLSSCEATLAALVRILERDGSGVPGRCDHVMDAALRLGVALKMPPEDLGSLRWGVLLQCLAAMAVPALLRSRDGSATPGDKELALKHEAWIIEALSPVAVLHDALEVLSSLYERWDGGGRPKGLKGEDIPLAARVLAVAVAWEPDQPGKPTPVAARLARLQKQSGLDFDPRLVEALERVVVGRQAQPSAPAGKKPMAVPIRLAPPRHPLLRRLSMSSTGARAQFAMAMALISVIPALVTVSLCMSGWLNFTITFEQMWPAVVAGLPFVTLGYWMLAKYPINIMRLRRYLDSLAQGVMPGRVVLLKDEDDLASIELLMKKVIAQTEVRVRTIETQTDALLDAERQRVMIQSLGAACHHLGQPATVINTYLQIVLRMELPAAAHEMLAECRTATEAVAAILERLQNLTVYRTEPYASREAGEIFRASDDIVRM